MAETSRMLQKCLGHQTPLMEVVVEVVEEVVKEESLARLDSSFSFDK